MSNKMQAALGGMIAVVLLIFSNVVISIPVVIPFFAGLLGGFVIQDRVMGMIILAGLTFYMIASAFISMSSVFSLVFLVLNVFALLAGGGIGLFLASREEKSDNGSRHSY